MSQNRSAEFYRGAVYMVEEMNRWGFAANPDTVTRYRALLAEAEAREASVPTAAEVIVAAEKSFRWIAEIATTTKSMENEAESALDAIAKWKEAQRLRGGK
jgi:hypothetical protein